MSWLVLRKLVAFARDLNALRKQVDLREIRIYSVHSAPHPVADIIFIHGLGGHAVGTWNFDVQPNWSTWLRLDFPNVSLWSLDYPADPSKWFGHTSPLLDRAKTVVTLFRVHGFGKRPVVVVAHSFGGLLFKQVCRHIHDRHPDLLKTVAGVLFLSTPHTGSSAASLAQLLRVLQASDTLKELETNTPLLRDLNEWFRNHYGEMRVGVLFETRDTLGVRVVDEGSADPGIPGVEVVGTDQDHFNICKPSSPSGIRYPFLRRFAFDALSAHGVPLNALPDLVHEPLPYPPAEHSRTSPLAPVPLSPSASNGDGPWGKNTALLLLASAVVAIVAFVWFFGRDHRPPPVPKIRVTDCGYFRDAPLPSGEWEAYTPQIHGIETFWLACAVSSDAPVTIAAVETALGTFDRFYRGYAHTQSEVGELPLEPENSETVAIRIAKSDAQALLLRLRAPSRLFVQLKGTTRRIAGTVPPLLGALPTPTPSPSLEPADNKGRVPEPLVTSQRALYRVFDFSTYKGGARGFGRNAGCPERWNWTLKPDTVEITSRNTRLTYYFTCERTNYCYDCGGGWDCVTADPRPTWAGKVIADLKVHDDVVSVTNVTSPGNSYDAACEAPLIEFVRLRDGAKVR